MLDVLKEATKHHPLLKFIWVLIGLVVFTSYAVGELGSPKGAIIGIFLATLALILIILVSLATKNKFAGIISVAFLAIIVIFITVFLGFTVSAFSISKPCNWVEFLEIPTNDCNLIEETEAKSEIHQNINGIVKDKDGNPVDGVKVWLKKTGEFKETNRYGLYLFEDILGKEKEITELRVFREGYQLKSKEQSISARLGEEKNITIEKKAEGDNL